jgi:endonuclease/exonuclease/phosphatase family metal-dependent hydrolase
MSTLRRASIRRASIHRASIHRASNLNASAPSPPIKCLTWNVCWGCMSNNPNDGSANAIANKCTDLSSEAAAVTGPEETFICLDNVITTIQAGNYNLIGLQESSNWEKIYAQISNSHHYINLKIENSSNLGVDLTTFYDKSRFTIVEVYFGNITRNGSDVRPYQIILFKDKDGKLFYFINLHNAHRVSKPELAAFLAMGIKLPTAPTPVPAQPNLNIILPLSGNPALSQGIAQVVGQVYNFTYEADGEMQTSTVEAYFAPERKRKATNIPVILMGDFNDVGPYNTTTRSRDNPDYWTGITFNGVEASLRGSSLHGSSLQGTPSPPLTCCAGSGEIRTAGGERDTHYGDYILHGGDIIMSEPCRILTDSFDQDADRFPTSDHLPVTATFILTSPVSGGKQRTRRKKTYTRRKKTYTRRKKTYTRRKSPHTRRKKSK